MKKPEEIELDTKTLRFIVAIVDEGGLSRAAEALYLSQPALSRYLKRAEEALGTPVFYREHSGLTLTAAGKVFINGARSMLHLEQEALQQIQASRQDRSASVSIAAQSLFLPFLDKVAQGTFKEQYPSVTIKLTEQSGSQVRNLISNGTVDLGFFMGEPSETPYFSQECLFTSRLVFCAAPKTLERIPIQKEGFHLSHFAQEPMMMGLENTFLCKRQSRLFMESGISSPNICARGRLRVLTDLLHLGYGNVILPQEAAAIPKERIFSFDPPELYSCMAAWCQGRPLTAPALAYLNAVKERIMDGEWTNAR